MIPISNTNIIRSLLSETLKNVIPQNITNVNLFKSLQLIAFKSEDISNLQNKNKEQFIIVKHETHFIILYTLLIIFAIIFILIIFQYKGKIIKMYKPEITDNSSTSDNNMLMYKMFFFILIYFFFFNCCHYLFINL